MIHYLLQIQSQVCVVAWRACLSCPRPPSDHSLPSPAQLTTLSANPRAVEACSLSWQDLCSYCPSYLEASSPTVFLTHSCLCSAVTLLKAFLQHRLKRVSSMIQIHYSAEQLITTYTLNICVFTSASLMTWKLQESIYST